MNIQPTNELPQPIKSQRKDYVFFVLWVLAFTIGETISSNLSPQAGNFIGGPLGKGASHIVTLFFFPNISNRLLNLITFSASHAIAGLFSGMTEGLLIGLVGWLVLRLRMKGMFFWFLYTFVADAFLGMSLSLAGTLVGFVKFGPWLQLVFLLFIVPPLYGLIIGGGQWLLLRRKLRNAFLWIFMPWLIELIQAILLIGTTVLGLTLFDVDSAQWLWGDLILLLVTLLFGILTGALLTWLMLKDQRYARFVQPN